MKHFFLLCLLFSTLLAYSQNSNVSYPSQHSIWLEGLGHGGFYSLNYERSLWKTPKTATLAQVGFAVYPKGVTAHKLWLPISLNHLWLFGDHALELGVGQTFSMGSNTTAGEQRNTFSTFSALKAGYRYSPANSRFQYKASWSPSYFYEDQKFFLTWITVGVGYKL